MAVAEFKDKVVSLGVQLEQALEAKDQAINMNYFLENQLNKANGEIQLLKEEINSLAKEKKDLEKFNLIMMQFVYFLCGRVLENGSRDH